MNKTEPVTPERIMQMAWGYAPTLAIEAAVRHRVFDLLEQGPRTVEELAGETGASVRGLTAISDLLVAVGLLGRENGRCTLTPESAAFLVSSKPGYHGMFFGHISDQLLPRWLQLDDIVRTGKPATKVNEKGEGEEFFAEFVESLFPISFAAASKLGEHLGIPKATGPVSVLDIGAGSGVWGIALAKQSPRVRIRAVDWPKVLEVTKKVARQHGVGDRLTTAPGDFLEADFGSGHNIATVGHVLHSEGRERSRRLLRKIFAALAPGGTIAIQEFVPNDERTGPPNALIFAVNMLVNTEAGDTFTFAEMSGWLREAGYGNARLVDLQTVSPTVLAEKSR
jgi:SAM-dependent methyltransferase